MIRSGPLHSSFCALALAAVAAVVPARVYAQEAVPSPEDAPKAAEATKAEGGTLTPAQPRTEEPASEDGFRTPVEVLTERMIGTASRSVRYDWRKSQVGFGLIGSDLLERNNFASTRVGIMARRPMGVFMGELAITHAWTWGTESTRKLALTPYRQHARPNRFELDVNVGYPLAEGIVTAWPRWFPPTELVFSVNAGARYLFYPGALKGATFRQGAQALVEPKLTTRELDNLEARRLGGMLVDPARYNVLAGLQLDLYFQTGGFLSPRAFVALPLLTPVNGTGLGWWWELSMSLGWAI